MTRIQTLASRPKRTLGALAVVLAAVGITVGSGANFTAQSQSPNTAILAAGNLHLTNGTGTIFNASDLAPGDSATGTVTIKNTGTVAGNFFITPSRSAIAGLVGRDKELANRLKITVTDDLGNKVLDDEPVNNMTSQVQLRNAGSALSKWAPQESHTYTFDVSFIDDNADGMSADGGDNAAQDGSVSIPFSWKAVSVHS
jgi:hypothetical protein